MKKKIWHWFAGLRIASYRLKPMLKAENDNNKEALLSEIILKYHVLEKGLSMPERRYCFGYKNITELCNSVLLYKKRFGEDTNQIIYAVEAIMEYRTIHFMNNQSIDSNVLESIDMVLEMFPEIPESSQPCMTREEFFKGADGNFIELSHGRHTCRHFEGSVDITDVQNAIQLAQETAPSACNRQSTKVKLINDKKIIDSVLSNQSGNRGFGHTFDKLIIITTDMSYWNYVTNIGGYIDGGIYLMNLLYALYYYKIGACTLNSYFSPKQDKQVRQILNLPMTESFVAIIGIGKLKENVVLAKSGRKKINEILKIY